ncbi:heavy metal translocating P-type ATPase [Methanococcus maripaludis]|uniref:Haloacid dehalogenase/epoxide hydrolase:ATPase, E1-E2 type:Heavy metal transport/detoxification protein n=1 Tax=Methanococcus maripaludis (strain DSM 14266 / JCM 13030 / NBRC 101832 / S2 / LL) TaxID=267377 RepID=Q6LY28_METMP|nr:heavy metal translocating P-type ATPase [Methanococcus maripaludis]CAF30721.1 Haloacid dehalogenase/epoxide hydrolase:ATPase, E1-E2 type:Heavy metal transport/detoxification protein [Methanococcus maripaludis S2]
MEVKLKISGMTCAVCVKTIEKSVSKMDGVESIVVNLLDESAVINFDEKFVSIEDIGIKIERLGYEVLGIAEEIEELPDKEDELKEKLKKIIVGAVFSIALFSMMYIEIPYKPYLAFLVSLPPLLYIALPIFKAGFNSFRVKSLNMDVMYSLGMGVAYISALLVTLGLLPMNFMFYDTTIMLATLLTLGRYLEERAKGRTSEAIKKLMGLQVKTAKVIRNNEELEIPIENVIVGDILLIRPGEKIAVDGTVFEGDSYVDESMITGEPIPNPKKKGDSVIGGTINKNGILKITAEKIGKDTVLSQIIQLVKNAQISKPDIQNLADKAVSYFIPVVFTIALISSLYWFFNGGILLAVTTFISVMVIACPCALGLATPTAITVGVGRGAELGILIKDSKVFDVAGNLKCMIFDKTGTITKGEPEVDEIISDYSKEEVLLIAGTLEKNSEHPLALAILKKAEELNISLSEPEKFESITGMGIIGTLKDLRVLIGNRRLMEENNISINEEYNKEISRLEENAKTVIIVGVENKILGIIAISDKIKENAKITVQNLREIGIESYMVTGDNEKTAKVIGKEVGILENHVFSNVLPEKKAEIVKSIKENAGGYVEFIGDGINDAPALSTADVGIAVGSGTDIAIESGEVVLMNDDLKYVTGFVKLSKRVLKQIKLNLFWAFAYNSILIPVAAGALYSYNIRFEPELAAFAMTLSSITIIGLSLLLKRYDPWK